MGEPFWSRRPDTRSCLVPAPFLFLLHLKPDDGAIRLQGQLRSVALRGLL